MEAVSAMRIGVAKLDSRGRIALFNNAAEEILGYSAREVRGQPCAEIFTGLTGLPAGLGSKRPDIESGVQLKMTARHKDGVDTSLFVTPYVMPDDDNPAVCDGVILTFLSVRELEKTESQLQHLNRLQSLDRFAAGIVHEIRNPLTGISTNTQYLLERISPTDCFHEEMQDILADVKEIERIVSEVLDFAHPRKSQVQVVSVKDIVEEVLRFSKTPLQRQNICLRTDFKGPSAQVKVDVSQIKQVLFNVVRNAREAMSGGGELHVGITHLCASDRYARVEMTDTGRGIAAEHLERIFDPFFSTHHEGTGLGLAISRKIVEQHGGRIEVKSALGKGAAFRIVLPTI